MALDLKALQRIAVSKGFRAEISTPGRLDVVLPDGLVLWFLNSDGGDEVIGFAGMPWHFHPPLVVVQRDCRFREFDTEAILEAISAGEFLVLEIREFGRLTDQWLEHRDATVGLEHTQVGEEIRVRVAGALPESPAQ